MAFYCATMLSMALELARFDPSYEDVGSKFFEHYVAIADAINNVGGTGLWNEPDGFYYDHLHVDGVQESLPVRVRSLVGLIPLLACENIEREELDRLPGHKKRMQWFLDNRPEVARQTSYMEALTAGGTDTRRAYWRSPRASVLSACFGTCSTRQSFCLRMDFARCRACIEMRRRSFGLVGRSIASSMILPSRRRGCWWQFELAWAGVVSDQLFVARGV
jgi:hypothetical protein